MDRVYQYPKKIRRVVNWIAIGVLLFNLVTYALAWIRAIYALLYQPLRLPYIQFLEPFQNIVLGLLVSHLGLLAAFFAARAVAFLTPRITFRYEGILMQSLLGKRTVPYTALHSIRSIELETPGRFVVWIDSTTALPLQDALASLLFGRWLWRGFLLTSDLDGFDDVIATIVERLKKKYGEAEFAKHYFEDQPTWLMKMLNAPSATIQTAVSAETWPITTQQAAWQMASVAASLALPMIVAAIIRLQIPWGILVVLIAALFELPLVCAYLMAIPVNTLRHIEFMDAVRVYPLTQLPRWVFVIGLTLLVIAGAPQVVMILASLPAIFIGAYPVVKLTEAWFEIKSPDSWLGALVTVIYQFVLYELLIVLLPK